MLKTPFSNLNIRYQRRYKNEGFSQKENTGLDTETYQGYTKLITDSFSRYKLISSFEDILNFLSYDGYRNKFNWFFNIQYDFESMIKFLDEELLFTLYNENTINYNHFKIFSIPKKFFSITDKNNHHYYFYDINNFVESSLEKVSKRYLNETKLNIIDAKRLNTDIEYWNKNLSLIIEYCKKDSILTKKVSDYFWNLFYHNLKFYPKRPFSKGKLSEEYFLSKCYIPTINELPRLVINYAYNHYHGGRFEILKRGYFSIAYIYDIKSAYPKQISELFDINKGKWNKVSSYSHDTDLGFYHCLINSYSENFSPFVVKSQQLNIFPNGIFYQYLTNKEIDFIQKYYPDTSIKVLSGVEFTLFEEQYPFKEEIEKLYAWKEKEKEETIKYAVKIVLNSLYGKMIQVTKNKTGKLFNPIFATQITSNTRLALLDFAFQNPDAIIAFSTDSVHTTEKFNIPSHPKLGDFSYDFSGKGYYIMSDIYTVLGEKKNKHRLRGFTTIEEDISKKEIEKGINYVLSELKEKNSMVYQYISERPFHLGECLIHKKKRTIKDINIFSTIKKKINLNGDIKRIWDRDFVSAEDALTNSINSLPILLKACKES